MVGQREILGIGRPVKREGNDQDEAQIIYPIIVS